MGRNRGGTEANGEAATNGDATTAELGTPSEAEPSVHWARELTRANIAAVGGKGANLGELVRQGFPVPPAFVIGIRAYERFREGAGLSERVGKLLSQLDPDDTEKLRAVSDLLRAEIRQAALPHDLAEEVLRAYATLSRDNNEEAALVAVRSSATAEDTAQFSFAGMFESFLNVRGPDLLLERVKDCWASTFRARVLFYRMKQGMPAEMPVAVVVQLMVSSDKAGVIFTVDPASRDHNRIVVEAAWGLGEVVVLGEVAPDHYVVAKDDLSVLESTISDKSHMLVLDPESATTARVELTGDPRATARVLSPEELVATAELARRVERYYGTPQDIEFAFERGTLYLTQARPITTLRAAGIPERLAGGDGGNVPEPTGRERTGRKRRNTEATGAPDLADLASAAKEILADRGSDLHVLSKGLGASPGRASGRVRILRSPDQSSELRQGEVLVARMTSPDWVPLMRRAAAVVTDAGGMTSHAAIVSRELGIPCVVGARAATSELKSGTTVTVDGGLGLVWAGQHLATGDARDGGGAGRVAPLQTPILTATRIYVNLAEPSRAEEIAALDVDGVGLLRAEFMLLEALERTHPRKLIATGRGKEVADRMSEKISAFAGAFDPRPVIYRAIDFRSNEFRGLHGGAEFEPTEENPMIGYRGCFRYTKEPDLFALELDALSRVRERFRNVHLMIPFVRTAWELRECKRLIEASPIGNDRELELWIMAEVPSVVHWLPEYARMGIQGVSIGSNDLTQLILGVDRDSESVSELFDERDEAVLGAIRAIIETSHRLGITCSICGQAPSVHEDYAERLVEWGIDSISVNPDVIARTRRNVAAAERTLLLRGARSRLGAVEAQ